MGWIHSPAHEPSLPLQDIDMKTSPKFTSESNSTTAGSAEDEVPLMLGLLLVSLWPTCRSRINNFYIFGHFVLLLILINYFLSCICTCLHIIRTQTLIPQLREKIIWGGWFLGLIYAQISPDGVSDSVFNKKARARDAPGLLPNLPWSFLIMFHLERDIQRPCGGTTHLDTNSRTTNGLIILTGDNRLLELDRER